MKIAIIDDLMECRSDIKSHMESYKEHNFMNENLDISEFESGECFLSSFISDQYDIIFIDYYLKEMTGIEIARKIRQQDAYVILIFITTSREHAVESYEVRASGYLVKPYDYESFEQTLYRAHIHKIQENRFICIENDKILLKSIIWCDRSGHYVQLHTKKQGCLRYRFSFVKLMDILSPYPQFLLCYRGVVLNMDHAKHIEESYFSMDNGDIVPFKQRDKLKLKKNFSEYIFKKEREVSL